MTGRAKGDGVGGAGGRAEVKAWSERELEAELRRRLDDVELICEADPPVALLKAAEEVCRRSFAARDIERLATRSPATLASYIAIRGAERYEGNALWPQLGVEDVPSWQVGRAFLDALRRMNLPDFQAMVRNERARRFVAPILIHGGIPAEHARPLVERLELELYRGLTDGPEAVRRLTTHEEGLGRPTIRLLRYVPDFSGDLLDSLIDQITGTNGGPSHRGIPRHLQDALDQGDPGGRRGLARLRVPHVEFDDWAGDGPMVVCPDGASDWVILQGDRSIRLAAGEWVEVDPSDRLEAQSSGRRRLLWKHPVLWFTDPGRLIPPDGALPSIATAVLPRGWEVRSEDGEQPRLVREGVALAGAWSGHLPLTFDLSDTRRVRAVAPAGSEHMSLTWSVASARDPELVGEVVDAVTATDGAQVFSSMPRLLVPRTRDPVPLRFTPLGERSMYRSLEPHDVPAEGLDLTDWLGTGHVEGRLGVRGEDGRRYELPLVVVPGLAIGGMDRPLAPAERVVATVSAMAPDRSVSSVEVSIPPVVDEVACSPPGGAAHLRLEVPRVRWALRSQRPTRLDLASSTIAVDVDHLLDDDAWLLVRCGRPARVTLELYVDGARSQVGHDLATRDAGGRHHQCAFPLGPFGDTLRRHREAGIELRCVVDGKSMPAVTCGRVTPMAARRTWAPKQAPVDGPDPWADVEWMTSRRTRGDYLPALASAEARDLAEGLIAKLGGLGPADQLVTFVRLLGEGTRRWDAGAIHGLNDEAARRWGPGGQSWAVLEAAADKLWRLQGVRYREFAGKKLEDGLRQWRQQARNGIRGFARSQREAVEQWTFGRLPPISRIDGWRFTGWVESCRPSSGGSSGVHWYPAALLYQLLAVAGGDEDAGLAVAAAVDVTPTVLLQLTAFLLEVARLGYQFRAPRLRDLDETSLAEVPVDAMAGRPADGVADTTVQGRAAPLRSLEGCDVEVRDGELRVTPPEPVGHTVLRLWSPGTWDRAVSLLIPHADDGDLVAELPSDLSGRYVVTAADPRSAPLALAKGVQVEVGDRAGGPPPAVNVRGTHLASLGSMRCQALIERVAHAVETMETGRAPTAELFEDEEVATAALVRFAHTNLPDGCLDRIGIAVLPVATVCPAVSLDPDAGRTLRATAPILWAAIGPRSASQWRSVGWPNGSRFAAGSVTYDDVIAFARRQSTSARDKPAACASIRYETPRRAKPDARVRETIRKLDRRGVDPFFVDLTVATYCALAVEAVTPEAVRMLVAAHHRLPDTTTRAVLVGRALHLASTSVD